MFVKLVKIHTTLVGLKAIEKPSHRRVSLENYLFKADIHLLISLNVLQQVLIC